MKRIRGAWLENENAQAVLGALSSAGFQALFVGGCVRNSLLGENVTDIDIATDARPQRVMELEASAGFKVLPTGVEHGTVTVIAGHVPHEITTFRRDIRTFGRHAVVEFADKVEDDAHRRDFTMNALYADANGTVIDPIGGISDLESRRVRFIDDPADRIREDYLRILRFFRFHAWYGDPDAGPDAEALAAIATHLDGLAALSRERVGSEIRKLLSASDPAPAVAAMRSTGVLAKVLPGADDSALGPLVLLEKETQTPAEPMRRLACLGGENLADRLRLSNREARRLVILRESLESTATSAELGYRQGFELARDVCLLRAAIGGTYIDPKALEEARRGAEAVLPVRAADLMPGLSGPALGRKLEALRSRWIASGFRLSRDDLLRGRDN